MNLRRSLRVARQWLTHPWVLGPGIGVLAILLSATLTVEVAELKLYDMNLRWRGKMPHRHEIVVVDISEKTFDELGRAWPFPRAVFAEVIETVQAAQPKAIGLDILFLEPSVFGEGDDAILAGTLGKYPNVILGALSLERRLDQVYAGGEAIPVETKQQLKRPIRPFRETPYGVVNTHFDADGFVRRAPRWFTFRGGRVETLAGQLYEVATRGGVRVRRPVGSELLINFRGPAETFDTVGFHQVYRREVEPHLVAGRIVLIGASSYVLHDVFNTPFAPQAPMPGVEIHANVLDNLLRGDPIRPAGKTLPLLFAIAAAAAATFVASRLSPVRACLVVVGVGVAYAFVAYGALAWYRLWLEQVPVQLALFGPYAAVAIRNYVMEERAKRRLSRFFSPAVAQDILKHEDMLQSQRRKITILFSDIRNFTTISEKLPPETVVEALRYYFNTMTPIIFRNGGSVDKFVGDAIMAFFNAPAENPDHADNALQTAIEMVRAVETLSPHWEKLTGFPLRIGVGINTGEPVIGTMGSDERLEYSCIGDAVNLAARLESATKDIQKDIIVSEYTVRELKGNFPIRPVEEIHVRGRMQPVQVYAVEAAPVADEAALRTLVDATLQTLTGTRAPSLTRQG